MPHVNHAELRPWVAVVISLVSYSWSWITLRSMGWFSWNLGRAKSVPGKKGKRGTKICAWYPTLSIKASMSKAQRWSLILIQDLWAPSSFTGANQSISVIWVTCCRTVVIGYQYGKHSSNLPTKILILKTLAACKKKSWCIPGTQGQSATKKWFLERWCQLRAFKCLPAFKAG